MRRIKTKEEAEKKERRNKIIISIILAAIMIFGVAGYSFFGNTDGEGVGRKVIYNGYEFELSENWLWQTKIQNYEFVFQYFPNETEEINISLSISLNDYANKELYFASDNPTATGEIAQNLINFLPRMPQEVCLDENCTLDAPIKNCSSNLIIIKEKDFNEVSQEDSCVFISGNYSDLVKISDAFLYRLLGVK